MNKTIAQSNTNATIVAAGSGSTPIKLPPGHCMAFWVIIVLALGLGSLCAGGGPPAVSTLPASNTNSLGATLNGRINPAGIATAYFQFGRTPFFFGGVTTVAGSGLRGLADGTIATAQFNSPQAVVVDVSGNIFVADTGNHCIREIATNGAVTTIAGAGVSGYADGPGTAALFDTPYGITMDTAGNLFVSDELNDCIRKVVWDGSVWQVTTLAGSGTRGYGDGSPLEAKFDRPQFLTTDAAGNVYVADKYNDCVRKIAMAGGSAISVSTLAGKGTFKNPRGVAVDRLGNVYVSATDNNKIILIPTAGEVSTLAGSGEPGSTDGYRLAAQFDAPRGVAVDSNGQLYIGDTANNLVRKIIINPLEPLTNQVRTVTMAGGNDVGYLDSADSDLARFNSPYGVALDNAGNVYVADKGNHRIRMVGGSSPAYVARLGDSSPAVNVSGSADIAVSFPATGLPAYDNPESGLKTLYYFRALGSNSVGMAYGSVMHFTTYSTNAMLEVLGVENDTAPLTPAFSPDITNYSATVPTATAEVLVSAIGERNFEDGSEISTHVFQVGGVTCNNPVPIGEPGSVTTITVLVTAQDGLTRSAYSIAVTRATTPLALSLPAINIAPTTVTLRGTMSPNSLTTAAGSYFQYSTKSVFGSGAWTTPISGFKPYTRVFWINGTENLAVDDLGNVYYGTGHAVTTVRVDPAGSPTNSQIIFAAASYNIWVYGCAVNHAGTEVYWGDQSYQALVKYVRNGNGWAQSRIASTLGWFPVSVALHEPSGNIYAVLYKASAGGNPSENKVVCIGTNGVVSTPPGATNLSVPMTVACDPAGNLYVMEYFNETLPGNNRLSRLAPDGQITSLVTTNLAIGFQFPAAFQR